MHKLSRRRFGRLPCDCQMSWQPCHAAVVFPCLFLFLLFPFFSFSFSLFFLSSFIYASSRIGKPIRGRADFPLSTMYV